MKLESRQEDQDQSVPVFECFYRVSLSILDSNLSLPFLKQGKLHVLHFGWSCNSRLDHQPLFAKGACAPPRSSSWGGRQTRHERAAEIEPNVIGVKTIAEPPSG